MRTKVDGTKHNGALKCKLTGCDFFLLFCYGLSPLSSKLIMLFGPFNILNYPVFRKMFCFGANLYCSVTLYYGSVGCCIHFIFMLRREFFFFQWLHLFIHQSIKHHFLYCWKNKVLICRYYPASGSTYNLFRTIFQSVRLSKCTVSQLHQRCIVYTSLGT